MTIKVRRYAVMVKHSQVAEVAPTAQALNDRIATSYNGDWTVLDLPEKPYPSFGQADVHDQFVSDCLKHIPVAFWQGKSREEIVLTYLSAVDDAMGLLAENIAARITREVKGT